METLGSRIAGAAGPGMQIHLCGELGAGKTTLVRGFLRGHGHQGKVKSPTYTLVEPYVFADLAIFHFDFYRIRDPAEVEAMGYREYPGPGAICLIEWPEKAGNFLGEADVVCTIEHDGDGRIVAIAARTEKGNLLINKLSGEMPG